MEIEHLSLAKRVPLLPAHGCKSESVEKKGPLVSTWRVGNDGNNIHGLTKRLVYILSFEVTIHYGLHILMIHVPYLFEMRGETCITYKRHNF